MDKQEILSIKKIQYDYDNHSDVLYISFGRPRKALTVQSRNGYLIRYEPFTEKLVGITIVDFKIKFFKNKRLNVKGFIRQKLPQIVASLN